MMSHSYKHRIWEVKPGALTTQGQPGVYDNLSQVV